MRPIVSAVRFPRATGLHPDQDRQVAPNLSGHEGPGSGQAGPPNLRDDEQSGDGARLRLGSPAPSTAARMRELSEFDMELMELRDQDEVEREAGREAREPLRQRLRAALERSTLREFPESLENRRFRMLRYLR
jgi:hypothetical protein